MLKKLYELTRCYSYPMSLTPFLIGLFCALRAPFPPDRIFAFHAILIGAAIFCLHLLFNLFDDFADVKNQLKSGKALYDISFKKISKARLILNETFKMKDVIKVLIMLGVIPFLAGFYFIYIRGDEIICYCILTLILAFFYPVSAKFCLQESIIGIIFGPLLINGTYFALTGQHDITVFYFSIASGIMTSILLITHSLMDYEFDIEEGKKTIPVLLKNKYLTVNFISILILISYFILIFCIIGQDSSPIIFLASICTIPVAFKLTTSLYDYIEIKNVEFKPKWYLGAMENWNDIKNANYEFFMYRFYLARNLAAIFNVALAIACLFSFTPSIMYVNETGFIF